jgi:hypothetical protein
MTKAPHRSGYSGRGNRRCLHCYINAAIGVWAKRNAPNVPNKAGGKEITLDVVHVICKVGEVVGELIYVGVDEKDRAAFERYAHECLEAAFEHQRTGEPIDVSVNTQARPS